MAFKKKAAGLRTLTAFKNSNDSKHTARRTRRQRTLTSGRHAMPYDPRRDYELTIAKQQRLKGAIVHAYNVGAISIEMCAAAFARCPHWSAL